uniref:Uncharacterized protein n=1 Tax=Ascaris lumbricoides TaxID=6252 RepID=A0A0M3ITD1_ASCLU
MAFPSRCHYHKGASPSRFHLSVNHGDVKMPFVLYSLRFRAR